MKSVQSVRHAILVVMFCQVIDLNLLEALSAHRAQSAGVISTYHLFFYFNYLYAVNATLFILYYFPM
jgi:hypothetical protein